MTTKSLTSRVLLLFFLQMLPLFSAEINHSIIEEDITHYWKNLNDKYEADSPLSVLQDNRQNWQL